MVDGGGQWWFKKVTVEIARSKRSKGHTARDGNNKREREHQGLMTSNVYNYLSLPYL